MSKLAQRSTRIPAADRRPGGTGALRVSVSISRNPTRGVHARVHASETDETGETLMTDAENPGALLDSASFTSALRGGRFLVEAIPLVEEAVREAEQNF